MSVNWDLPNHDAITGTVNPAACAAVEKLQELNGFLLNNQVLQCSTRRVLDEMLRELRGHRSRACGDEAVSPIFGLRKQRDASGPNLEDESSRAIKRALGRWHRSSVWPSRY